MGISSSSSSSSSTVVVIVLSLRTDKNEERTDDFCLSCGVNVMLLVVVDFENGGVGGLLGIHAEEEEDDKLGNA